MLLQEQLQHVQTNIFSKKMQDFSVCGIPQHFELKCCISLNIFRVFSKYFDDRAILLFRAIRSLSKVVTELESRVSFRRHCHANASFKTTDSVNLCMFITKHYEWPPSLNKLIEDSLLLRTVCVSEERFLTMCENTSSCPKHWKLKFFNWQLASNCTTHKWYNVFWILKKKCLWLHFLSIFLRLKQLFSKIFSSAVFAPVYHVN